MARAPTHLSKIELVSRAARRAERYGISFGVGRLDEWIKQGLALASKQRRYDYRAYRRVLQLIRFYSEGRRDRDELMVRLYLRGYGVRPDDIRVELQRECWKALCKIAAPLRSVQFDRTGPITNGRLRQLKEQLGTADPALAVTGFVPSVSELISFVRAAKSHFLKSRLRPAHSFRELAHSATHDVMLGILSGPTYLKEVIQSASCADFENAREGFRAMLWVLRVFDPTGRISVGICQREFSAMLFLWQLKFSVENPELFSNEQIAQEQ